MKYFYLITLCCLFITTKTKADTTLKPFELEISLGGTYGIDKYIGHKQFGPALGLEGRYNFHNTPMDIGMELYLGSTVRKYEGSDLSNRILSLSAFSDYNFKKGKKFSPFIGIGIGIASYQVVQGPYGDDAVKAVFTPRLGVEMFNHFRLTAYSKLGCKGYNNIGISVGYAIGGGKKR